MNLKIIFAHFKGSPLMFVLNSMLILLLIYILYQMIMSLLGHSWGADELTVAIVSGLLINSVRSERKNKEFIGEMKDFKRSSLSFQKDMRKFQNYVLKKI